MNIPKPFSVTYYKCYICTLDGSSGVTSLVWFIILFVSDNTHWSKLTVRQNNEGCAFIFPAWIQKKCIQMYSSFFFFLSKRHITLSLTPSVMCLTFQDALIFSIQVFFCHLALKWGLKLLEILNVCASKTSWFTYRKTGTKTMHSINPSAQFKQNEIIQWMCQNDTTSTTMSIL